MPSVVNSSPMLEEQAASLITDEDFLLEQQQTLSRECAESVLTSNDLTENFLMSEEELEELLPLDLTSAQYVFFGPAVKNPIIRPVLINVTGLVFENSTYNRKSSTVIKINSTIHFF